MTAEELARIWQDGLKEAYGDGQRWEALSEQQKNINIRVATKVLERLTIEEHKDTLDNRTVDSLFDQAKLATTVAHLANHIQLLSTEIFGTAVIKYGDGGPDTDKSRQTLLGRVNELSAMAGLRSVDQSFFAE